MSKLKFDEAVPLDPFRSGVRGQESVRDQLIFDGIDCSDDVDMCRQEHALSTDIKFQIQRYGVGHQGVSGQVDFDNLDLTRALELLEESAQAWLRVPKVVRDRYQSWAAVERAAQTGELDQLLKMKAADAGAAVAPASAASPSDSAAVPPPKVG